MSSSEKITQIVAGWLYRDTGRWDDLLRLFHEDGQISVTWFEGPFAEFVRRSRAMGRSDLRTKHLIGVPLIEIVGERAFVETNVMILADNVKISVACRQHARFLDLLECREGVWGIVRRECVYDMGEFVDQGSGIVVDPVAVRAFPEEYAPLAYVLERSGFPLGRVFPTRGGILEGEIREAAGRWLARQAGCS